VDDSTVDAAAILTPVVVEQALSEAQEPPFAEQADPGSVSSSEDVRSETSAEPLEAVEQQSQQASEVAGRSDVPESSPRADREPSVPTPAESPTITFSDSGRPGQTPPFTRATAVTHAEAIASQVSTKSGTPLGQDQLQRNRTDFLDAWDSRWQYP